MWGATFDELSSARHVLKPPHILLTPHRQSIPLRSHLRTGGLHLTDMHLPLSTQRGDGGSQIRIQTGLLGHLGSYRRNTEDLARSEGWWMQRDFKQKREKQGKNILHWALTMCQALYKGLLMWWYCSKWLSQAREGGITVPMFNTRANRGSEMLRNLTTSRH